MAFDKGSISFTICKMGKEMPEDAIEKFAEKKAGSLESVVDEPQVGWVSGRHLLDTRIDNETAYAGGYLHLTLRTVQKKIPPSLLKAEMRMEELALLQAEKAESLSRKQKKEIKKVITERLLKDMPPSITGISFVVDQNTGIIYLGSTSQSQIDQFLRVFYETIGFEPISLISETASEVLYNINPDSLPIVNFSPKITHTESDNISLGRDFATWVWYFQENEGGTFEVEDSGTFNVMVDGPLVLAADGRGALEAVIRKGLPTTSSEAKAALLVGKKLKQAKFTITKDDQNWTFTLDADNFSFRSMRLPEVEKGLDPMSQFQERIKYLDMFRKGFMGLFKRYLDLVIDSQKMVEISEKFHQWIENLDNESE